MVLTEPVLDADPVATVEILEEPVPGNEVAKPVELVKAREAVVVSVSIHDVEVASADEEPTDPALDGVAELELLPVGMEMDALLEERLVKMGSAEVLLVTGNGAPLCPD